MELVELASTLIDEHCGRTDGLGNGSLVYTTYRQQILMPSPGRNVVRVAFRPLVGISAATQATLQSLDTASGGFYYTGFTPNQTIMPDGSLTSLLSASGRYSYARRDSQLMFPDFNALTNPLNISAFFGGPPQWTGIDIGQVSVDPQSGELWIPAGINLGRYSEVIITYNSGFDPRFLPSAIKKACAAVIRNSLPRGGTTGMTSFTLGRSGVSGIFTEQLLDVNIQRLLQAYVSVVAY